MLPLIFKFLAFMYVNEVKLSYSEWDSSSLALAVWKAAMSSVLLI